LRSRGLKKYHSLSPYAALAARAIAIIETREENAISKDDSSLD
jgi:hypothetical protein